jgi:AcrR family transcriptional regulator
MPTSNAEPGRVYGGLSTAERDVQRQAAILDAGFALFGTKGFRPTSMTEIAERADVPFRYVGRLFADKPALLEAVFVRIQDEVIAAIGHARAQAPHGLTAQIRAGLHAAFTTFADDPRRARISCLEVVGISERLQDLRRRTSQRFVAQLVSGLDSAAQEGEALPPGYALLGVGLVGAVEALLTSWTVTADDTRLPLGQVIEAACLIYLRTLGLPEQDA